MTFPSSNPQRPEGDSADEYAQHGTPVDDPDVPRTLPAEPELNDVPVSPRSVHNVHQQNKTIT